MAFKLKSGNRPSFKEMGSSPNAMRMTQDPRVNMGDRGMMTGNMKDKTMSHNYKDTATKEKAIGDSNVGKIRKKPIEIVDPSKTKVKEKKTLSTNTKDPYAEALKNDPNLPEYIKKRKELEADGKGKGDKEWDANQNRINTAYNKGPIRGSSTDTTTKASGKTITVEDKPGVSTTTTRSTDKKDKVKHVDHIAGTVTTSKTKAGPDGEKGTDDDKKKTRTRKKFSETKIGKTKVGQIFVKKDNKQGGINAAPNSESNKKNKNNKKNKDNKENKDNKSKNSSNPMA